MSATGSKFKVGDRVRCTKTCAGQFTAGATYTVRCITASSVGIVEDDAGQRNGWSPQYFELVAPIRTVTRREIVPGQYGRIKTIEVGHVGIGGKAIPVAIDMRFYNADELREAAHIFNQIAEVLEENEKEAA